MARIRLIVDEELVVKSIEKLLKKEGYEVVSVRNGHDALTQVQEKDFDLLVTDIRMPSMTGIEAIEKIRDFLGRNKKKPIPEICITGYADNELNQRAEALGVADYLYKPFDLRDFMNCIKRNLQP